MSEEKRFAVLIDADNIAPKYVTSILNEISNKGTITYKRVYCDWTGNSASGWKKVLLKHSLTPIQQYIWKKCYRLSYDNRRYGYSVWRRG